MGLRVCSSYLYRALFSPSEPTSIQLSFMTKFALLLLAFLLLALLAVVESGVVETEEAEYNLTRRGRRNRYGTGSVKPYQCSGQCRRRCGRTQYKKPCLFFCNKCCKTCLCVPPGFYGNKSVCPCYNNWKTKRGGPKCP